MNKYDLNYMHVCVWILVSCSYLWIMGIC